MTNEAKTLVTWVTTTPDQPLDAAVAASILSLPALKLKRVLEEAAAELIGKAGPQALKALEAALSRASARRK